MNNLPEKGEAIGGEDPITSSENGSWRSAMGADVDLEDEVKNLLSDESAEDMINAELKQKY